ncbi:MAG: glycosyltransferase family 2 protein [Pantoea sp.]|uniref:glycosyltransferase family 2 protein n=1 Tax=Pantoea sp. TaxID=69393 RepID=UPI0039E40834
MMMSDKGNISILMGTYNGEKYLESQLQSIASQTYKNWTLIVSDDGSTDHTCEMIEAFAKKFTENKVVLLKGPAQGFAANFLYLLRNPSIVSDYYAFCDQDDIWCDDKLEVAIEKLSSHSGPENQLQLYGSRTSLVNSEGEFIGMSPCFEKAFKFQNALLQSYAGGNTMVFNRALKEVFEGFPPDITIVSHDWILYIICSAMNGVVIYDKEPKILYRQHGENLVGSNIGFLSKVTRFRRLFAGEFKSWCAINCVALDLIKNEMPVDNKERYLHFLNLNHDFLKRIRSYFLGGFYRQNFLETCAFFVMNLFRKLV